MTEKQYICEHTGEHVECSSCPHGTPHRRNAMCVFDDCDIDCRECECVVCEHAKDCDIHSDVPSEELLAPTREAVRDSIEALEATERNLTNAIRDIHRKLDTQRDTYRRLCEL